VSVLPAASRGVASIPSQPSALNTKPASVTPLVLEGNRNNAFATGPTTAENLPPMVSNGLRRYGRNRCVPVIPAPVTCSR
jgi:hypothetical protein